MKDNPGSTSVELFSKQRAMDRHEISRRLADLLNGGQVRKGQPRQCAVRGTSMVTWYPAFK